jgi:methylmalonyl-CoA epimerase
LKLDHLGVAVRSIDAALELYRDGLGLAVRHRGAVEHEGVEVAMLPAGDARIELLEPVSQESVVARFLERRGEGLHHIAMEVDDLEAAVERLKAQGRRLVTDSVQTGAEGYRYVFVHPASAGGVLLELIER